MREERKILNSLEAELFWCERERWKNNNNNKNGKRCKVKVLIVYYPETRLNSVKLQGRRRVRI